MPLPIAKTIIVFAILLLLPFHAISGSLEDGFIAYKHGNKDLAQKKWLPLAIKGDFRAQFFLSVLFDSRSGSKKDKNNSKRWLTASANNGFIPARFNLGNNYHLGKYGAVDNKMAAYWWNQAAVQGFPEAQYHLATLYYRGKSGIEPNQKEAFYWFKQAANQGYQAAAEALLLMRAGEQLPSQDKNNPVNIAYDDHRIVSKLTLGSAQISPKPATGSVGMRKSGGVSQRQEAQSPVAVLAKESVTVATPDISDNAWLSQQPMTNYTIQLSAAINRSECDDQLKRLARSYHLSTHVQFFTKNARQYCAVIYGSYGGYGEARAKMKQLPYKIRQAKPWIRKLAR